MVELPDDVVGDAQTSLFAWNRLEELVDVGNRMAGQAGEAKGAEVIRDAIDPTLEIVYDDPREGDAEHTHADVSKANELLGYEPTVDIREGVEKFIQWYRENKAWYDPLVRNS